MLKDALVVMSWCCLTGAIQAQPLSWQPLRKAPSSVIRVYQSDKANFQTPPPIAQATFSRIKALYVIDPHWDGVCGSAGCLLVGYLRQGNTYRNVLGVYVKSTVRVSPKQRKGLPCLEFLPVAKTETTARWCYTGKVYDYAGELP